MEYLINILDKPLLSLAEASRIMNCSKQTVKKRIKDGFIKCASRHSKRCKVQVYTQSIIHYLER